MGLVSFVPLDRSSDRSHQTKPMINAPSAIAPIIPVVMPMRLPSEDGT
jgi:hypothetical protein